MATKKKLSLAPKVFKRRQVGGIEELRAEMQTKLAALLAETEKRPAPRGEREPLPMPTIGASMAAISRDTRDEARVEAMRPILEKFVDKRLTAYFDAKPGQYADMQNLGALRNRMADVDATLRKHIAEVEAKDARTDEAMLRLGMAKACQKVTQRNLDRFVGLGFWGRFKWLIFGPKRLLSTYPCEEDCE